jgi:HK97 family phage prohead protease
MDQITEVREFVQEVDEDLHRAFPFEVREVKDSGAGAGVYTIKGLASVYDKPSLDLGGFVERIAPAAFDQVLASDPHVLHVWDHNTRYAFSSTRSSVYPLELKSQEDGLAFFSRVAPTTYSQDLRTLIEGGVIDQSSFAFTVAEDEWRALAGDDGEPIFERTVTRVAGLFDVTTCAMGAYPQTHSELAVRTLAGRSAFAVAIPKDLVAPPGGPERVAPRTVGEPQTAAPAVADTAEIARLKRESAAASLVARERLFRGRSDPSE